MSQTSIESYFQSRKRPAGDEARGKNKVLILDQNQTRTAVHKIYPDSPSNLPAVPEEKALKSDQNAAVSHAPKKHTVVRNIQFDSPKGNSPKTRRPRTRRVSVEEGQADIRETFQKKVSNKEEAPVVPFQKKGPLTPKKSERKKEQEQKKNAPEESKEINTNPSTPKKASDVPSLVQKDLNLDQIKGKLLKSKRLNELRARINKISELDKKLENIGKKKEEKKDVAGDKPVIKKFDSIELEIPVSPQKTSRSLMMSPTKTLQNPIYGSPNKLMSPKKCAPSPVKTPIKEPAYKRFADLASEKEEFALPDHYRLLGEIFRCIDTISAMMYNRNETITLSKLKPSVQEMLRRNLTTDHLAQIKFLYPEAYEFKQEKYRKFAQSDKQEKYDLTLTPIVEKNGDSGETNDDSKETSKIILGANVLLERRRKMFSLLLDKVMDEHQVFLESVGMDIDRKDLTRWHPAFDINSCKPIEKAELPAPPNVNNCQSASEILQKAKNIFDRSARMGQALQLLANSELTQPLDTSTTTITKEPAEVHNSSVIDTPPSTPKVQPAVTNSKLLKGIPKALLEKVRAKQAAKALEEMTRPAYADKEIAMYAQLPSMAQILRNIFVTERKNVLTLEFVLVKLDNSFRTKMTMSELENHIRLMSSLLPTWISVLTVRKVSYVKLLKNVELNTIVERLELFAKDKVESFQSTRSKV